MSLRLNPLQHDLVERVSGRGGSIAASETASLVALLRLVLPYVQIEREVPPAQSAEHTAGQEAADAAVVHLRNQRAQMGRMELGWRSEFFDTQNELDTRRR